MSTMVGQLAPDFQAEAVMPNDTFGDIQLSSFRGKYVILFFYPLDFSFICPTEVLAFDKKLDWFKQKNCEIIGASVDSIYTHLAWRNTALDMGGIGKVHYPLVSDLDKSIAQGYGVLHNDAFALRAWFLIDKDGYVRHELVNDQDLGRNVEEMARTLEALIFTEENEGVCPANWHEGEEALQPTPSGVADYLGRKK